MAVLVGDRGDATGRIDGTVQRLGGRAGPRLRFWTVQVSAVLVPQTSEPGDDCLFKLRGGAVDVAMNARGSARDLARTSPGRPVLAG